MSKTLWNYDSQTAVVSNESPGVLPGESRVFSDEELDKGFTGRWGDEDPRRGLAEERAWKRQRDEMADEDQGEVPETVAPEPEIPKSPTADAE